MSKVYSSGKEQNEKQKLTAFAAGFGTATTARLKQFSKAKNET
jgi:hypothetical protein